MRRFYFALALTAAAAAALSQPFARELNTNTTLYMVDVATNSEAPIGNTPWVSDSLAMGPGGNLYSASPGGNIFDVTGGPIPIGVTGRTQIGDLDYGVGGLWGYSNATSELFFFDIGLATVTYAATITNVPGTLTITGVAYDPTSGGVYLSGNTGLNLDKLIYVAPSATTATLVGNMTIADNFSYIADIDFGPGGVLYAMTFYHREFYTVSTVNGATTFLSGGPHRDTTAMALSPVPEPGTLAAIFGGCIALRRRRR